MTCDNGAHWRKYGLGVPNSPVIDVVVDTNFHRLIAATMGRGAWSMSLPGSADSEPDGDVDLADFATFQACFTGPSQDPGFTTPTAQCLETFDFDFDNDIDLSDYLCLHNHLTGPG
jgi:hypothetical protein